MFTIPIIFLLILIRAFSVSAPYDFNDPTDDVRHYQSSVLVSTGDFHDEIDITNFNIHINMFIMFFDAPPIFSTDRIYLMSVFWDGDSNSKNYTIAQFGGGVNQILTYLFDSQDNPVALSVVPGAVSIVGNSITATIPAISSIQDPTDPQYVDVHASYIEIAGQNYYTDNLTYGEASTGETPGFEIGLAISGLSIIIIVRVYLKRKE
jgi:hypothetical protein